MTLLNVENISKSYGGIKALQHCTMNFTEGAINGLIGPNGSGKTTLFNIITGYETPDSGAILFRGNDITSATPDAVFAAGIGRTFQLTRIFPRLTVLENVHIGAQRPGLTAQMRNWSTTDERERAIESLDFVGLTRLSREPAGSLSYGQQKLLEFAFIMVARPKVMLLDEPAGGVNPSLLKHLGGRIKELNKEGVTFIIVEHDMEFVMDLCDQVSVMHQGSALREGTPAEVRNDPAVLEAYLGTDMTEAE
jgi:neutral amino acid transport system ATP-binding protein